jgi:hypothetical protein
MWLYLASPAWAAFGVQPGSYSVTTTTQQAGAHPDLTIAFDLNLQGTPPDTLPDENVSMVNVTLPPGLLGDPQAAPRCTSDFLASQAFCPSDSQVGVITYTLGGIPFTPTQSGIPAAVYNMVPEGNYPAELAFVNLLGATVKVPILTATGPSTGYRIVSSVRQITAILQFFGSSITLWGVPTSPSHDSERGSFLAGGCLGLFGPTGGSCPSNLPPKPFLSNATQCATPGATDLTAASWQHPGQFIPTLTSTPQLMTGCELLQFKPSLTLQPQTRKAGAPSGYTVDLHVPQNDNPTDFATPHLKKASVTLPEGVRISPSAADGLQACSDAQIELTSDADPTCPESSRIATVKVSTPLLADALEGFVYQGTQTPGHLLRLFLVVKGPGVLVKLAGSIDLNPSTGQITTTFDNNPQLPFEDLQLSFKGGPRAPLVNPSTCGTYTTTSDLTPWSTPFTPDATPSDSFQITEGCGAHGFSPSFLAGTVGNQAGTFAAFTVTIARSDGDEELSAIQVSTPPGLLGVLKSVPLCDQADANAGTCPAASQIGHTTVGSGAGPSPVFLPIAGQPANPVYLTQGYKGAPFGLSVVVPAIAGPFNLGTVVERAAIRVDPHTAAITITSDPLPRILQGIPLQVKTINVTVDRPGFIFNPTNCSALSVTGTLASYEATTAAVSSPFRAHDCASERFAPKFSVSTNGRTNKASGASLQVHLATNEGPTDPGTSAESALSKVEVSLPTVLPSKLSTLQKACLGATFDRDPAACPPGAFVGSATARTPLLANPLTGPAILVSHGGQAFPDLVLVLQGEGIRLDVLGHTQITKGVTFSRFQTVPDAPVSSFDLNLPQGPNAVLAANGNLCANTRTMTTSKRVTRRVKGRLKHVTVKARKAVAAPLLMPTTMTAQNGAVMHQTTKIAVTGCPTAKASKHPRMARHR